MAKKIMGENFIGVEELSSMKDFTLQMPDAIPTIPFSEEEIERKKNDYLLILGISELSNRNPVNIKTLIDIFGKNPNVKEPCFYNQDWYDKEEFIEISIQTGWFFVRKEVYEDSRSIQPDELIQKYSFPLAVNCVYAFFVAWQAKNIKLWCHDFIWCSDTDHNGDRIYVGKYHDVDGMNKNGFSIHRHLALRPCYGCIDSQ